MLQSKATLWMSLISQSLAVGHLQKEKHDFMLGQTLSDKGHASEKGTAVSSSQPIFSATRGWVHRPGSGRSTRFWPMHTYL